MKKSSRMMIMLIIMALSLYGCGSSTTTTTSATGATDTVTQQPNEDTGGASTEKATVKFSVQFPKKGDVGKSLLDPNSDHIYLSYYGTCTNGYGSSVTLTPDPATGIATTTLTFTPGNCYFDAYLQDVNGATLDRAFTSGVLSAGGNTIYMTFIKGAWTFVGADGVTPETITLAGGESLRSFWLTPYSWPIQAAGGVNGNYIYSNFQYNMKYWQTDVTGDGLDDILGFNPETAPYGIDTYLHHYTQFSSSNENVSNIDGGIYNLTDNNTGNGNSFSAGDRAIWFLSATSNNFYTQGSNDAGLDTYKTSTVASGNTISGNIFEGTFETETYTFTNCPGAGAPKFSKSDAAKKAISGVSKASSTTIGNLSFSYSIGCNYVDTGVDTNGNGTIGDWGDCYGYQSGVSTTKGYYYWYYSQYCYTDYDYNGNGVLNEVSDFEYKQVIVNENYSNVTIHPFTAKGSELGTLAISNGTVIIQ